MCNFKVNGICQQVSPILQTENFDYIPVKHHGLFILALPELETVRVRVVPDKAMRRYCTVVLLGTRWRLSGCTAEAVEESRRWIEHVVAVCPVDLEAAINLSPDQTLT